MDSLLQEHRQRFQNYVQKKIGECAFDPFPLVLKQRHTCKVLENAEAIAQSQPEICLAAVCLAALYHDIARFEQYLQYKTFKDANSFNHGSRGVKILKQERLLENLNKKLRQKVLIAVGLHNRFRLPQNLQPDVLQICNIVRDADKLDILRVMDEHLSGPKPYNPTVILSLPDNDLPGNPLVCQRILKKQVPGYADLKNVNDFRLLLGAWLFDMHFEGSKDLFRKSGHAERLLQALPDNAHYGAAKNILLGILAKHEH